MLALLAATGAVRQRRRVVTRLTRPVPYLAELDLGSWLQRLAFVSGGYEPELPLLLTRLRELHPASGALLDVGANVGLISIPAALLIPTNAGVEAQVISFEPAPENVQALRGNIQRNALGPRVQVEARALGEQPATAWIEVERSPEKIAGSGTANLLPSGQEGRLGAEPVEVATFDGLKQGGWLAPPISVVKLDTDGYDLMALRGALSLLRDDRPFVVGEFSAHCIAWHGQTIADVVSFARRHAYRVAYRCQWDRLGYSLEPPTQFKDDLLLVPGELENLLVRFSAVFRR